MRKRAVWVNIPFANVAFTETAGNQVLLVPEDWEASFTGLTNEQATLRAIVGEVVLHQTVVGTAGGTFMWGIYMAGVNLAAASIPTFSSTGMSEVSWLRTGCRGTSTSVTDSINAHTYAASQPINITTKRKLDSSKAISIVAQFGTDAASPAGIMGGLLRFLVARD